jgi:hypothetical protein
MTTYKGAQASRQIQASDDCGNSWQDYNKVTPSAALATTDKVVLARVPAGVTLTGFRYRNGDFDTGTTLAVNVGYESKHATPLLTANATYFLSASTALQAAQATWVEVVFDEITFNEPVDIVMVPSANATGVSGTPSVYVQLRGQVVGVL